MDTDEVVVRWPNSLGAAGNWGDKLNPFLVRWVSRKKVIHTNQAADPRAPSYLVIGSALARARNKIVWGSGFIASDQPSTGLPVGPNKDQLRTFPPGSDRYSMILP